MYASNFIGMCGGVCVCDHMPLSERLGSKEQNQWYKIEYHLDIDK